MIKTTCTASLLALALSSPAQARDIAIAEDKTLVLGCLEALDNGTTWPQCVSLMFQPCNDATPGSAPHAACLEGVREEWAGVMRVLQDEVLEAVSPQSKTEVIDLLGLWTAYVVQKCTEVAAAKPTGTESARLGCEVSELAGLSGEFAACLEGRSTADYCKFSEE